jgi:nicotinamide riboside kinase
VPRLHEARRHVGAESTGKTTLAIALAEHYQTTWVPEFDRPYTEARRPRGDRAARFGAQESRTLRV